MEAPMHSIVSLFDQLGLESTQQGMDDFIDKHKPLASNIELSQAEFWSDSQASFIKETKDDDADWAEIVDQFDTMLR